MARRTSGCAAPLRHGPSSSPPSGWCHAMKRFIRTSCVIDLLRLVRAHNLLVAAAGVLAGGWIALGALAVPRVLAFAALAAIGFGAAGNTLNDLWDVAADRVNRPGGERPLTACRPRRTTAELCAFLGVLLGVAAAALAGGGPVLVGLLALGVMAVYSPA